jgi:hypothetical protein
MARRLQVAVIGGRRASEASLQAAEVLGARLVGAGCRILCGGRDGVMAAVCRGAKQSPASYDGCTVGILPGPDGTDANRWVDVVVPTGLGLARNVVLVQAADAVVAISGEAGTLSEIAVAWQLGRPLCALDTGEGWASRLAGHGVDTTDRPPIFRAQSPEDVIPWLLAIRPPGNAIADEEIG